MLDLWLWTLRYASIDTGCSTRRPCHAYATDLQAMPYIKDIVGVGLARGIPNWKGDRASHTSFGPIFMKCRDMGLHLTAHAGELPPHSLSLCSAAPCSLPLPLHYNAVSLLWSLFTYQHCCHHVVLLNDRMTGTHSKHSPWEVVMCISGHVTQVRKGQLMSCGSPSMCYMWRG